MTKKSLKQFRARIRALTKKQDEIFNAFLKKNKIKKGSLADDILFDYSFNNYTRPDLYLTLKEEGIRFTD